MMHRLPLVFFLIVILFPRAVTSQSLPVGSLEEEQLRLQLLLSDSLHFTPVNRPYSYAFYRKVRMELDGSSNPPEWWHRETILNEFELPAGFRAGLLPINLQNVFNSGFPVGDNNDAAWHGRGINTEFGGGAWLSSNWLTISLNPRVYWQQNQDFLVPRYVPSNRFVVEGIAGVIDAPYRFGPDPFWTLDWGYSSARIHYGAFETGLSSEPLWWGPTMRHPLMMSNNAPGIVHAFIGTREPFQVPFFGDIQFKWIVGYPQESDYADHAAAGETRFINALNGSWSPAFLPTLTLGATRSYQLYEVDGFDWQNITVMFDPFQKSRLAEDARENWQRTARNQTATFYAHIFLPGARAEIYGEFYREDHSFDWRDFLQQPHQNGAWAVGFQKIFDARFADMYKVHMEFTNLTMTQIHQTRPQTYYYAHSFIRHGHTNRGHILGAAIGPGSSSQFFSVNGYRGDYKLGIFIQRASLNDNFHLRTNAIDHSSDQEFGDYYRHRVNLNLGLNFLYGPGPFYLTGSFIWTKAYNYGRFDYGRGQNLTNYDHKDLYNSQLQMGITYVF